MARRLISESIISTSRFIGLPKKPLAAYPALLVSTDDEGFVEDPTLLLNEIKATPETLKQLEEANMIEIFSTGAIHITDFDSFNKMRNDRYTPTRCACEKEQLHIIYGDRRRNPGKRRAISADVVLSSAFLRLPKKAILLYLFLLVATDDEGFVADPALTMSKIKATTKTLDALEKTGFIEVFASGVVHIAEFSSFNWIRKDRLHPTKCTAEKEALTPTDRDQSPIKEQTYRSETSGKDANTASLPPQPEDNQMTTECLHTDTPTEQNETEQNTTIHPLHSPASYIDAIEW